MANVIPQGELKFYSGIHTGRPMLFSSASNRDSYFSSHQSMSVGGNNYTVIKKQANKVRVTLNSTNPGQFNYLSFRNPNFEDLTYYCRILDYYWINQECCEYTFAIDIWLTYCFDVTYNSCFIERESLSEVEYNAASSFNNFYFVRKMRTEEPLGVCEQYQEDYYSITPTLLFDAKYGSAAGDRFVNVMFATPFTPPALNPNDETYDQSFERQWYEDFINVCKGGTATHGQYTGNPGPASGFKSADQNNFNVSSNLSTALSGHLSLTNKITVPLDIYIIENNAAIKEFLDHITIWGAISGVVAIYTIPLKMLCGCFKGAYLQGDAIDIPHPDYPLVDVNYSPKLAAYPFMYLEIISPDGNKKEYQFEHFMDRGTGEASFHLTGALNGVPKSNVLPVGYKSRLDNGRKIDYTEGMVYQAFPQLAYCTDAFLAYIASASTDLMRSNTAVNRLGISQQAYALEQQEFEFDRQSTKDVASAGFNSNPSSFSGAMTGYDTIKNTEKSIEYAKIQQSYAENALRNDISLMKDSYNLSLNNLENNAVYQNLRTTQASFVTNDYHKTSEGGYELYDTLNPCDFIAVIKQLRYEVAMAYTAFFKEFGYALNTVALPIVANYVSGDSSIIHWDDNKTYIKTRDMHVDASLRPVQEFIEAMFNGGTQFVRGESL